MVLLASKINYKNLLRRNPSRVLKYVARHPVDDEITKLLGTGSGWKEQRVATPFSRASVLSCWYYYYQNMFGEVLEVPAPEEVSLC